MEMVKTILFIPGFVCDTFCNIEKRYVYLAEELANDYNVFWLVPTMNNPYSNFLDEANRHNLQEPLYVSEAKKHNIKLITADLSKYNLIKNYFVLKKIFKQYNVDATFVQFGFERYIGTIFTKLLGKKVIYSEHGYPPRLKFPLLRRILYNYFVDYFVTISNFVAETLPKNKHIEVTHNAKPIIDETIIDEEKNKKTFYKESLDLNKFDFVVLMIAAFRDMKRHDLAIKIAEKVIKNSEKNIGFVFLGTGELFNTSKEQIAKDGFSENILMPGHVSNINEYLAASDMHILTSLWEPFGICLLESMNYKLATLSFASPSAAEIITNGEDGYLIPLENVDEYAEKILFLIENPQEIEKLGQNAYHKVKNNFDIDVWLIKMKKVFDNIFKKDKKG